MEESWLTDEDIPDVTQWLEEDEESDFEMLAPEDE